MKSVIAGTILLAALVAGCGGGSESSTTVTLNPDSISATFAGNNQSVDMPGIDITASVSPPISSLVYPYVIDEKGVLIQGGQVVNQNVNGSYSTRLYFNRTLSSGIYTGTLMLKLCKDVACSSVHSINGGTLPYTLTVTPGIEIVSATINGVSASPSSLKVKSGDVVTLQSSVPVTWSTSSSGVILSDKRESSTEWTATLEYGLSVPGWMASLLVTAMTESSPTAQITTTINVTQ